MIDRGSPAVSEQTILDEMNSSDWEKKKRAFPVLPLADRQNQKAFRLMPRPQQLRLGDQKKNKTTTDESSVWLYPTSTNKRKTHTHTHTHTPTTNKQKK